MFHMGGWASPLGFWHTGATSSSSDREPFENDLPQQGASSTPCCVLHLPWSTGKRPYDRHREPYIPGSVIRGSAPPRTDR